MSQFCVINTEHSAINWSPINFHAMFESALRQDGDQWHVCNIAIGEALPSNIKDFQGIVITGSHYNCRDRDNLPWFEELSELIRYSASNGSPNFYGGCFGCQMIAHALGGEVDYNPEKQFALKAEDIRLQPNFNKYLETCPDFDVASSSSLNILVSHGDCVVKLPPNSELLASSNSCCHEIFVTGVHKNIFCCQSHPEWLDVNYTIMERVAPSVIQRKRIVGQQIEDAMVSFKKFDGKDARKLLKFVSSFLHTHAGLIQ